jgi:hypothetical protein
MTSETRHHLEGSLRLAVALAMTALRQMSERLTTSGWTAPVAAAVTGEAALQAGLVVLRR